MHAISRAIREFIEQHPLAAGSLDAWYRIAKRSEWSSIVDIREDYPHADAVGNCTVFNIHGNRYRLIAEILYEEGMLLIRGIYTHKEYSKGRWKDGC